MDPRQSERVNWGGRLWILAVVAVVLAILILVVILPRPLAYVTPPPTAVPWTPAPGLYVIPTVTSPPPAP